MTRLFTTISSAWLSTQHILVIQEHILKAEFSEWSQDSNKIFPAQILLKAHDP